MFGKEDCIQPDENRAPNRGLVDTVIKLKEFHTRKRIY
jgi:hypothetical protein